MRNYAIKFAILTVILLGSVTKIAAEEILQSDISSIIEVQQYNRAIHIMAMLLIGFGFLMVFVKKYGRSAITATFLLVSVSIPILIGCLRKYRGISVTVLGQAIATNIFIEGDAYKILEWDDFYSIIK